MMLKKWLIVLGLFLLAPSAFAEDEAATETSDKFFGVLGGFTTNQRAVLQTGIGSPGLQTRFLYGITPKIDIGGILELNWGDVHAGVFALRFQFSGRFSVLNYKNLGLSVGVTPGLRLEFAGATCVDILLHTDFTAAYKITNNLIIAVAFEMPIELLVTPGFAATIPLMASVGMEYNIKPNIKLWWKYRNGAGWIAQKNSSNTPNVDINNPGNIDIDGMINKAKNDANKAGLGFGFPQSFHAGVAFAF